MTTRAPKDLLTYTDSDGDTLTVTRQASGQLTIQCMDTANESAATVWLDDELRAKLLELLS